MKETDVIPLPIESCTITGYVPTSRVVGIVAVTVLEFTKAACKGVPIMMVTEVVKLSPLIITGTLLPCNALAGDMLRTIGAGRTMRKRRHTDSSLTCSYISGVMERMTATAQLYSPGERIGRVTHFPFTIKAEGDCPCAHTFNQ
jgi:hypothetical protein